MTQLSLPWNGTTVGDAGPYSDSEWWEIYKYLAGAHDANTGVLIGSGTAPDTGLSVNAQSPTTNIVEVTPGAAMVQGTFYKNDATETIQVSANGSGNARIDTIILRKDIAAQTVRLAILTGTPAATPIPPTLTQNLVTYEIPVADIAVASGFVSITQADITPRRYFANAADGVYLLDILNNSGDSLQTGDVVVWDTTANRAVKTTTTLNDPTVAGVWIGYTANGGYGRVLSRGVGYVRTAGVSARGLQLTTSTSAKIASVVTSGLWYPHSIGVTLETTSGSGLCLAYVNAQRVRTFARQTIVRDNNAGFNTSSTTFVNTDLLGGTLTITLTTTTGNVIAKAQLSLQHNVANARAAFDIAVNGVDHYATTLGFASGAALVAFNQAGAYAGVSLEIPITGLAPGSYTFTLRWRTITAGTLTAYAGAAAADTNFPLIFTIQEVD